MSDGNCPTDNPSQPDNPPLLVNTANVTINLKRETDNKYIFYRCLWYSYAWGMTQNSPFSQTNCMLWPQPSTRQLPDWTYTQLSLPSWYTGWPVVQLTKWGAFPSSTQFSWLSATSLRPDQYRSPILLLINSFSIGEPMLTRFADSLRQWALESVHDFALDEIE